MIITIDTEKETVTVSDCENLSELFSTLADCGYELYKVKFLDSGQTAIGTISQLFNDISHT